MDSTYHLRCLVRNLRTGNDVNSRLARALADIREERTRQGEAQCCDASGADETQGAANGGADRRLLS